MTLSRLAALVALLLAGVVVVWFGLASHETTAPETGAEAEPARAVADATTSEELPAAREAVAPEAAASGLNTAEDEAPSTAAPAGPKVAGIVLDAHGDPLPGAIVRVLQVVDGAPRWADAQYAEAHPVDPKTATFELRPDTPGQACAIVASHGSGIAFKAPVIAPAYVELRMPPAFEVRARIVDEGAQPLEGARLVLADTERPWAAQAPASGAADADGQVVVQVPAGRYGIAVRHEVGRLVRALPFRIDADTDLGELVVGRGATIEVRVISDFTQQPLDDASVRLVQAHDRENESWRARLAEGGGPLAVRAEPTGVAGTFRFTGLRPGEHTVFADADGHAPQEQGSTVVAGDTVRMTIALASAGELIVTVVDEDGVPVTGFPLRLFARSLRRNGVENRTDGQGFARFFRLQAGDHELCWSDGERNLLLATLRLRAERNERKIVSRPLEGVVIRAHRNGEPVAGLNLRLFQIDATALAEAGPSEGRRATPGLKTDAAGRAALPPMQVGDYRVSAWTDEGRVWQTPVSLYRAGQLVDLDCGGVTVSGRVVPDGAHAEVRVKFSTGASQFGSAQPGLWRADLLQAEGGREHGEFGFHMDGTMISSERVTADENGAFVLEGCPPGSYALIAIAEDGRCSAIEQLRVDEAGRDGVRLELFAPATLRFQVSRLAEALPGEPREKATVRVYASEGGLPLARKPFNDGVCELSHFAAGRYRVVIEASWMRGIGERGGKKTLDEFEVDLTTGETMEIAWDGSAHR